MRDHWSGIERTSGLKGLAVLAGFVGMLLGAGGYTFFYAEGLSYLSSDPSA